MPDEQKSEGVFGYVDGLFHMKNDAQDAYYLGAMPSGSVMMGNGGIHLRVLDDGPIKSRIDK